MTGLDIADILFVLAGGLASAALWYAAHGLVRQLHQSRSAQAELEQNLKDLADRVGLPLERRTAFLKDGQENSTSTHGTSAIRAERGYPIEVSQADGPTVTILLQPTDETSIRSFLREAEKTRQETGERVASVG